MRNFLLFTLSLLVVGIMPALAQLPISGTVWSGSSASTSIASDPSTFTTVPASVSPGSAAVNVSQWNRNGSITGTATSTALCYNSSNWEIGGSFAAAQTDGKYIYFTVTNNATTELEVTAIHLATQISGTGPTNVQWQYAIGAGADQNFGVATATAATASPSTLDFTGIAHVCPGQTATFKLYGWGGTGAAGTLRINDNSGITATWAPGPPTAIVSNSTSIFAPACSGNPVTFTSLPSGGVVPYTYSWSDPGSYTSTDANPIITAIPATGAGTYSITVTDAYCCTSVPPATTDVYVNAGPDTTMTLSGPLSFCTPGTETFTVPLNPNYLYDWYDISSGTPLSVTTGLGTNSYTTNVSGQFYVQITDIFGTGCMSTSDTFTVNVTTTPPATITASSLSVCSPAVITLSTPTGTGYTYQWYSAATGAIPGATNATYNPTASGTYSVTVINGSCSATSVPGTTVTLNTSPTAPVVTPAGPITVCSGSPITLTSTNPGGVTFQWKRGAVNIPFATNSTYAASLSGTYSVVVTGAGGCTATSNAVSLTLNPLPTTTITANPGTTICSGSNVTLSTTSSPNNTYQWLLANAPVPGATNATYTTSVPGTYRVLVTNTITGCSDTTVAPGTTLTLNPSPSASDAIISPAGPFTICSSDSVVLSTPGTTPGLTYQWFRPATIAGATNTSYTARVTGTYTVRITNSFGCSVTSAASVSITVNPAPSAAITLSGPATFCEGSSLNITTASGPGYTYQWHDATGPIGGATAVTETFTASGTYYVIVTSANGCQATSTATTVNVVPTPYIIVSGSPSFCAGNNILLTVSTIGIPGVIYQWKRNGVNIPGAVSATYAANVTGTYTCFVNIPGSCATLTTASVINVFPTVFPDITFDGTYVKTYNFYVSYQWYKNTVTIPGATNYRYAPWENASYRVLVTDTNGCQILSHDFDLFNVSVQNPNIAPNVLIYPNPATDQVHIDAPIAINVSITTLNGKVVMAAAKTNDINISSLANGLYMILVYDEKGNRLHTEKLVKN